MGGSCIHSELSKGLGPRLPQLRKPQTLGDYGPGTESPLAASLDGSGNGGRPASGSGVWTRRETSRKPCPTDDSCGGDESGDEGVLGPPPWFLATALRPGAVAGSGP